MRIPRLRRPPAPPEQEVDPAADLLRHLPGQREERRLVMAAASRLLQYPDVDLDADLPSIAAAVARVPAAAGLAPFLDWSAATPLLDRQRVYVSTFDLKRRCCLYLTYYLNGDTRRRGMALLRFKQSYAGAGMVMETGELPDFLPVVLEFAVHGDEAVALALLDEHRSGLELLQTALSGLGSPYADVLAVLLDVLPGLTDAQREEALRLVAVGPPVETVGLEPYAFVESIGVRA